MTDTLQDALMDVRRAYRLLASYQQRMFELLSFVREHLGAEDYYQSHVHPLPQGIKGLGKQENSGMRYLPFYDLSAIWLKHKNQDAPWDNHLPGDMMFGAWVRSDTGFDKHSGLFDNQPVEQTQSVLVLSVVVCDQPMATPCNWYGKIWNGMDYPQDGEVNATDVPGYRCYAQSIALEQLSDRSAIETALADWCARASHKLNTPIGQISRREGGA
ncbi:hypothetical protein SAMN05216600_11769 [Pseudomonas cuatrocienegasensis]|uniref:Uncharacterized protein n=1 Tax=Pseudomonas cuatrocienegasensis TaxID=543360 RepID=A0ABY1BMQ8_9PSED|nr:MULTISPECIES: hypothetical protein [Pseudomonas]OEC34465.1 hypothetical protein A7D25_13990 [Pseudomonas sp. 21C1]SER20035.1 hypothetical protein SAMN05216600_11769 [Pseudomonas cuatrocienegasensis]